MVEKCMGYKRKPGFYDYASYGFTSICLLGLIKLSYYFLITFWKQLSNFIFNKTAIDFSSINYSVFLLLILIFFQRKSLYNTLLKAFMKIGYNFKVNENIELILYNGENVKIPLYGIDKIEIKLCKLKHSHLIMINQMSKREFSNYYYDFYEIKIVLKDTIKLERNIKNGIFYNIFNIKNEKHCLYLYEIMYDKNAIENIEYLENLFNK